MKTHANKMIQSSPFWGGAPFALEGTRTFARWAENPDDHLRFTGLASDLGRLGHNGWYVDSFQDETARGVVYQLPARNGKCLYLAGVADVYNAHKNGSGPAMIEVREDGNPYVYDDKEDAARNADSLAEAYAESAREHDAKQLAETEIEDKTREIASTRNEIRELVGEMRSMRADGLRVLVTPSICGHLWSAIARHRREIHQAYKRIAALKDNYWNAVPR
jgi:hypothetical protein